MMGENTTKKQNKELAEELFETKRLFENLGVSPSILEDEKVIEILANKEIRDTIEKYEEDVAKEIAARIAIAAHRIRNKDEVVKISRILGMDEVVNTIRKYKGSPAKEIADRIANAAYILRNEDEVVKISRILGMDEVVNVIRKYEESVAREVADWIARIAYELRDEEALIEIARTIEKYEGNVARKIANKIAFVAYLLRDKDEIVKISRILGMDEVVNVIRKYEEDIAKEIADRIATTAYELRDEEALIEIARTIEKYEGSIAKEIAYRIAISAYELGNKDEIVKISRILGMDEVVNTIRKYEGVAAEEVAIWIGAAAHASRNKDEVAKISRILGMDEVVNTIRKYEGSVAREIVDLIVATFYESEDENEAIRIGKILGMDEVVNVIKKYKGVTAEEVAIRIVYAITELRDASKVTRLIRFTEKFGEDIFDFFSSRELYKVINLGLDNLVRDKKDLYAIAIYIKSNKELPLPTKNNIDNYLDLALNHLKSKYGLKKDINYDQLLLLFSTQRHLREEIINLVNISKEVNPKYYSLSIKDGDNSLNYSRKDLEKYSIIAIVGSKNKNLEKEAIKIISSIVGEKTVNRARNEFYKNYRNLIREIANAFNEKNYEKAISILKQTNNEAIIDVINAINYRDVNINSNVVKAVESKNPLDYDNRIQMACVYLPYGARMEDGILKYCKDDRIKLIKYDIGNKTLGSAICYLEDKKLLVDSIEGHRRFRKEEIFEIVYRDLIERAKEWGVEIVIFNTNVMNETSRKFLDYLKRKNLEEKEIEMKLNTGAYLEAKKPIRGYIVRISQ
ncbi:MAG: hypothetical protein KQA34_01885 [Candidatus Aenigmarchaeota archaeon]|nr:hypothetical protein [Candidatus Aenigmarchaeota archaeon]